MEFGLITVLCLVAATLLVLAGLKLLFKTNWFFQFLRGFFGFGALLLAFVIIMSGLNIASYSQLSSGQELANISFTKLADQSFEATVTNVQNGEVTKVTIDGDMWQVDARIIQLAISATPFYKLDRISGRYYSLDQERTNTRSAYPLSGRSVGIDLWTLFKGFNIGILSASYGSATYMPMAADALYSISIGPSGLVSTPVNSAAQAIVNEWQ